jgi:hypothetical protein
MAHGILVGGWEPWNFIFPILGIINPTDKLIIFQRGRSTTNQRYMQYGNILWTYIWKHMEIYGNTLEYYDLLWMILWIILLDISY